MDAQREVFRFLRDAWDVSKAQDLILEHPRATQSMQVAALASQLVLIALDADHVSRADLTKPLLFARHPATGKYILIDGHHRVQLALQSGVTTLPAYFLTEQESQQIRIV